MTLQQLPTEAQCLVDSIQADLKTLVLEIQLPLFMQEIHELGDGVVGHLQGALKTARMQQFNAMRLQDLVYAQTAALRTLFSHTSHAVDQLRVMAGNMKVPADDSFACMADLANMQAQIVALFHDEAFPGD